MLYALDLGDIEALPWQRNINKYVLGPDGTLYGYEKAAPMGLALPVDGVVVDVVRIYPGHVVEEHHHRDARENFAVIGNEPIIWQVRDSIDADREEMELVPGVPFTTEPGQLHRAVNPNNDPAYLWRHATKKGHDYVSDELAGIGDDQLRSYPAQLLEPLEQGEIGAFLEALEQYRAEHPTETFLENV